MNKKPVFFSIVVPIYNVSQFLDQCVESILSQTYSIFELILVNDGSTDGSEHKCNEYKNRDSRVKVIHKKNGGLVSARKAGVAIAQGDYVVCVDGDDWIKRTYLQEINKIISEYNPDVICFGYYKVNGKNDDSFVYPYRKGMYEKTNLIKEIYPDLIHTEEATCFPPSIWSKVYKLDLYQKEQLLVDNRIKIAEDAACTIPCLYHANNIYIYDQPLYYYQCNNDSMTREKKSFSWDTPELIELHLRNRIKSDEVEFQQQISRRTVHALVNVVKTQFYCSDKYKCIKNRIKKELNRPIYIKALKESKFKKISSIALCQFFLLHNIYFPFYLLSKIK